MKAFVYHAQLNVRDAAVSFPFYRAMFDLLELRCVHAEPSVAGYSDDRTSVWLIETPEAHRGAGFHRRRTGLNHVAFRVPERADVDRFTREFVDARGLARLYRTPREFPEYRPGYYAVFFEDPDRVKLEVVHIPEPRERARG